MEFPTLFPSRLHQVAELLWYIVRCMVLCKRTVDYHHVRSDQFEDGQLLETKSSNGKILVTVYNSADNRVSDVIIGYVTSCLGKRRHY